MTVRSERGRQARAVIRITGRASISNRATATRNKQACMVSWDGKPIQNPATSTRSATNWAALVSSRCPESAAVALPGVTTCATACPPAGGGAIMGVSSTVCIAAIPTMRPSDKRTRMTSLLTVRHRILALESTKAGYPGEVLASSRTPTIRCRSRTLSHRPTTVLSPRGRAACRVRRPSFAASCLRRCGRTGGGGIPPIGGSRC